MSEERTITDQANTNTMREATVLARHLKRSDSGKRELRPDICKGSCVMHWTHMDSILYQTM